MTVIAFDVESQQDSIFEKIVQAIQASDLTDRQKRVFVRRLRFRPRMRQTIIDEVVSQAWGEGLIFADATGQGDVQIMVDWDALIEFIERLIPLIIKLIDLFG